MSGKIK